MSELPKMEGIVIAGTVYVKEKDCRANVNAALQSTAKQRTALVEALETIKELTDAEDEGFAALEIYREARDALTLLADEEKAESSNPK